MTRRNKKKSLAEKKVNTHTHTQSEQNKIKCLTKSAKNKSSLP